MLSREEVLELFFEDLELPDLVKLNLKEVTSFKPRRAGFAITGSADQHQCRPHHARRAIGRRIALRRPKQAELEQVAEEIARAGGGDEAQGGDAGAARRCCARLTGR